MASWVAWLPERPAAIAALTCSPRLGSACHQCLRLEDLGFGRADRHAGALGQLTQGIFNLLSGRPPVIHLVDRVGWSAGRIGSIGSSILRPQHARRSKRHARCAGLIPCRRIDDIVMPHPQCPETR